MTRPKLWYLQFGAGLLIGTLVIGLIDLQQFGVRLLVKALATAVLAVAMLVWWDRRKAKANKERP